jgi:hypothetical protein
MNQDYGKVLKKHVVSNVQHRLGDSPIWTDLLKIKKIYLSGRVINVKNGRNTLLWTDPPGCRESPFVGNIQYCSNYVKKRKSLLET